MHGLNDPGYTTPSIFPLRFVLPCIAPLDGSSQVFITHHFSRLCFSADQPKSWWCTSWNSASQEAFVLPSSFSRLSVFISASNAQLSPICCAQFRRLASRLFMLLFGGSCIFWLLHVPDFEPGEMLLFPRFWINLVSFCSQTDFGVSICLGFLGA